jgi:hypothetical protein
VVAAVLVLVLAKRAWLVVQAAVVVEVLQLEQVGREHQVRGTTAGQAPVWRAPMIGRVAVVVVLVPSEQTRQLLLRALVAQG